jgi:transcriptional regulator with GAF, ATPase, and Fis domain
MQPRLVGVAGPLAGSSMPLNDGETSVGRDETSDLAIADPAVSPRHCVLAWRGGEVTVRDYDRHNPTFINGLPAGDQRLRDGDEIQIGDSLFVLRSEADEPRSPDLFRVEPSLRPPPGMIVLRREDVFQTPASPRAVSPERLSRDLATLMRTSAAINAVRGLVALERPIIELIADAVPASRGALLFVGDSRSAIAWNRSADRPMSLGVSSTVIDRVMRDLVGILYVTDVMRPDGAADTSRDRLRFSVLAAPLVAFDHAIGAIVLETDARPPGGGGRSFDEDHLRLVMAIAGVAATAFAHAHQMEVLESTNRRLQAEIRLHHNMVGESAPMREVYRRIARVAPTDSTVLITGESGTGKELVARAIHRNSPRAERPFVAINGAAITETLLESELFGHEKGAFTGAVAQKPGKLEIAAGGSVFLDEIGELAPALQAKLLRVLQDKTFERVGGTRPVQVDFRLLAATNRDLKAAIDEGRFRQDLYYRLNVVALEMPPLRERAEDVPALADWFLRRHRDQSRRPLKGFSPEVLEALSAYDWPGNVRELENAVEHAVILGVEDAIVLDDLPDEVAGRFALRGSAEPRSRPTFRKAIEQAKIDLIAGALKESGDNHSAAARQLGLHPNYLHRLMRNLKMRRQT